MIKTNIQQLDIDRMNTAFSLSDWRFSNFVRMKREIKVNDSDYDEAFLYAMHYNFHKRLLTSYHTAMEFGKDAVFVSRIVDYCFAFTPGTICKRNVLHPFPLNFYSKESQADFFTTVRLDVEVMATEPEYLAFATESKGVDNGKVEFYSTDLHKLLLVCRVNFNLIQLHFNEHDRWIPFLVVEKTFYCLYLFFKDGEDFRYVEIGNFLNASVSQMAKLIFNLRNLADMLVERNERRNLTNDKKHLQTLIKLKKHHGRYRKSTKSKNSRSSAVVSQSGGSRKIQKRQKLGNASVGGQDQELSLTYKLFSYPKGAETCPNHVRGGTRISDGLKVVVKESTSQTEVDFLKLLNSPGLRGDPRNRTVSLLDVFDLDESYKIVFPRLTPLEDGHGRVPVLDDSCWKTLEFQL
jgi:hypothetical protein